MSISIKPSVASKFSLKEVVGVAMIISGGSGGFGGVMICCWGDASVIGFMVVKLMLKMKEDVYNRIKIKYLYLSSQHINEE